MSPYTWYPKDIGGDIYDWIFAEVFKRRAKYAEKSKCNSGIFSVR